MADAKSRVYIFMDSLGRIIRIEGQYTLPTDLTGWVCIEEGQPCDRLNLAQAHYFPDGLYTADGIPRYALRDGCPVLRTGEEIEEDRAKIPVIPSEMERLKAENADMRAALNVMGVTE